jgi:hypothetical protein
VLTDPGSELDFLELAGCQGKDKNHDLLLRGFDAESVQSEEGIHGLENDAFVPVSERVVVSEAKPICGSQRRKVSVGPVEESVLGALQCRFKETSVPEPAR